MKLTLSQKKFGLNFIGVLRDQSILEQQPVTNFLNLSKRDQ